MRFNSIDVSNKYHPISIHKNEVTKPCINNKTRKRRPTPTPTPIS